MRVEEVLAEKLGEAIKKYRGLRRPSVKDLFARIAYLGPEDFKIEGYKRSRPVVAFNPGAIVEGRKLLLFPRLIFDYFHYISSVGVTELDLEELLNGSLETPLPTKVILWPKELWEFLGCEDPRVVRVNGSFYVLYTGRGYALRGEGYEMRGVQGFAELDRSWRVKRRGYFSIRSGEELFVPRSHKDSAILGFEGEKVGFLTRPEIRGLSVCWGGWADLRKLEIEGDSLKPVLVNEKWEWKVGWSTNALKLSKDEYLVGWHSVLRDDNSYRDGLALVSGEGELMAISDYLLAPKGVIEEYGDRPLVIFGDGLIRYKEYLLWIGGVGDYAIAILGSELDKVLEELRTVRRC